METAEEETGAEPLQSRGRARRAVLLIVTSLVTIVVAGAAYERPGLPGWPIWGQRAAPPARSDYQIQAIDFTDPRTGWVLGLFPSGDFGVLHTADAGATWKEQLSAPSGSRSVYMKFFDAGLGLIGTTGAQPHLYQTFDGGATWSLARGVDGGRFVLSWSFSDPAHGWMLTSETTRSGTQAVLHRTGDGGATWSSLGPPVQAPDLAFGAHFADRFTGWLDAVTQGPYAYRSDDGGDTWSQVALPPPAGGWTRGGEFLVAASPTRQLGVVVTVADFTAVRGRSGIGGTIVQYPPLMLRTFDGGVPVHYWYSTYSLLLPQSQTAGGSHRPGGGVVAPAPNQVLLGSVDGGLTWSPVTAPASEGAIGYSDAWDWWWIGSGAWARSADAGVTWTDQRPLGVVEPIGGSLQLLDQAHGWFAAAMNAPPTLEATDDAGVHWRMVFLPLAQDRAATP